MAMPLARKYGVSVTAYNISHEQGPENYGELGDVVFRSLKPRGLAMLPTIGRNTARPVDRWVEERIFPGSCPPGLRQMMDIFEGRDLEVYAELIEAHFAQTQPWMPWSRLPNAWLHWAARRLLRNSWFTRRVVLDNWFPGHAV